MGVRKWMVICITVLTLAGCVFVMHQSAEKTKEEPIAMVSATPSPLSVSQRITPEPDEASATPSVSEAPTPVMQQITAQPAYTVIPATPIPASVAPTEVPKGATVSVEQTVEPKETLTSVAQTKEPKPVPDAKPGPTADNAIPETSVSVTIPEPTPAATAAPQPSGTEKPTIHVHTPVLEKKEATCLESGYVKEFCSECGEVLKKQSEIMAQGHDFEKSVWESPTCQMGGYYNNTCKRCGVVECVTEAPLPHEVEDIVIQEGNCMEDTIIRHICKNCNTQVESDTRYTPYDRHTLVTELIDGNMVTSCVDCGVVK